jgi:hypothetical protein
MKHMKHHRMSSKQQHKQIARTERRDAMLANKEGKGNLRAARRNRKKGNKILAKQQTLEAKWDFAWGRKRNRIANKEAKKGQ